METLTGKVTNITQADGRGAVMITVFGGDGKPQTVVAIQYTTPGEAAAYTYDALYEISIKKKGE